MIRKLIIKYLVNLSDENYYSLKSYFWEILHDSQIERYCKQDEELPF